MMGSKKVFWGMIVVLVLLSCLAVFVLIYGDIFVGKQAKKLVELRLENRLLDEQQAALIQANKDIVKYKDLEDTAKAVVPQDKDQARAVREIIRLAADSGIKISSVSFPTSSLGAKPSAASNTSSSSTSSAVTGETTSPSSSSAQTSSPVSQAKPVEGVPGVYSLEMTIVPDSDTPISYYDFLSFLTKLENNRRTAQVTSVTISPIDDDSSTSYISFSLTLNIFVKP